MPTTTELNQLRDLLTASLTDTAERSDTAAQELAARARAQHAETETLAGRDLDRVFFTVAIHDPWDDAGGPACSCKATERGLRPALLAAEREYCHRSGGSVRTDGVLSYRVTAHLDSADIPIPAVLWAEHSEQDAGTYIAKEQERAC